MNIRIKYVVAAAILASLSACGSTESGSPQPGSSSSDSAPSSAAGGSSDTPNSAAGGPSAGGGDVDPCSFLPPDQAAKLGVPAGVPALDTDQSVGCDYKGQPAFRVIYFNQRPYQDKVTNAKPVTVNGGAHAAVQGGVPSGVGCVVSMELTDSTSVEVLAVNTQLGDKQNCQVAKLAAQAVEPNLPQG